MERALARAPRLQWRSTGVEEVEGDSTGGAGVVAVTRLTLVLPPTVTTFLNLAEGFQQESLLQNLKYKFFYRSTETELLSLLSIHLI